MQQLTFPLPPVGVNRVQAIEAYLAAHGWQRHPSTPAQTRRLRWHLPGTDWYVRATWHVTTLYRVVEHSAVERRLWNTAKLGAITLALDQVALLTREVAV